MSENMEIDILIHTVSGEMWFVDGYWNDGGTQYQPIRPVPADNPTRKALEVGETVYRMKPEGWELPEIMHLKIDSVNDGISEESRIITIKLEPSPPPEPVGLKYLKGLAVGTRILADKSGPAMGPEVFSSKPSGVQYMVSGEGLVQAISGRLFRWRDPELLSWRWVDEASSETCPEWTPEQEKTDGEERAC